MKTDSATEKITSDGRPGGRAETARPPSQRRHFQDYRVTPLTIDPFDRSVGLVGRPSAVVALVLGLLILSCSNAPNAGKGFRYRKADGQEVTIPLAGVAVTAPAGWFRLDSVHGFDTTKEGVCLPSLFGEKGQVEFYVNPDQTNAVEAIVQTYVARLRATEGVSLRLEQSSLPTKSGLVLRRVHRMKESSEGKIYITSFFYRNRREENIGATHITFSQESIAVVSNMLVQTLRSLP